MTLTANPSAVSAGEISLGSIELIPLGEGREFKIGELSVAVFRPRGGRVFATQPDCPHKSAPLADGLLGGNSLICPFHSRKFDLSTGREVNGNCTLDTYSVRVDEFGLIILSI